MTNAALPERLADYFQRLQHWLEQQHTQHESLQGRLSEPEALDAIMETAAGTMAQLENFLREQRGLLSEWQPDTEDHSVREAVRAQAHAAAQQIAQLVATQETLLRAAAERMTALGQESQELAQSREGVRGYRPGLDNTGGFLDRDG